MHDRKTQRNRARGEIATTGKAQQHRYQGYGGRGATTPEIGPARRKTRPGTVNGPFHRRDDRCRAVWTAKAAPVSRMAISRRVGGTNAKPHRTTEAGAKAPVTAANVSVTEYR